MVLATTQQQHQQHQQRQQQLLKNWVFTGTGCGQLTALLCFVSFSSSKCRDASANHVSFTWNYYLIPLACLLVFIWFASIAHTIENNIILQ